MLKIDDPMKMSRPSMIWLRPGLCLTARPVRESDAMGLQDYFRGLSVPSRYSRMLGAISELPRSELYKILYPVDADHVALIATLTIEGVERIVGEARLVHDPETERVELALSVDDQWQKQGLGAALFDDLQRRAAMLGPVDLFGDTLRTNDAMLGLVRKSGFALVAIPDDWRLVRFVKRVDYRGGITPSVAAQPAITAP